jgi:hypothetical protein
LKKMAASSTSRFCLVSKEDIERLIDNAIPLSNDSSLTISPHRNLELVV